MITAITDHPVAMIHDRTATGRADASPPHPVTLLLADRLVNFVASFFHRAAGVGGVLEILAGVIDAFASLLHRPLLGFSADDGDRDAERGGGEDELA